MPLIFPLSSLLFLLLFFSQQSLFFNLFLPFPSLIFSLLPVLLSPFSTSLSSYLLSLPSLSSIPFLLSFLTPYMMHRECGGRGSGWARLDRSSERTG